MRCPTLKDLPLPPHGRNGWPWSEQSAKLPEAMPDGSVWPRISIVTPSLNQGQFIEETIRSVLLQGYPDLEYIIIDGGSTDLSLEIIKKYERWVSYWVSEPDQGQSSGINKGFKRSTGAIGAWINSDDLYEPGVFPKVAEAFSHQQNLVLLYGDCKNIDDMGKVFSLSTSRPYDRDRLIRYWPNFIPQPTAFFLCSAFKSLGGLDTSLHFAMDYDFWIRLGSKGPALYLPLQVACFRVHENSKTSPGPAAYWPEMRAVSRCHGSGFFSPMYIKHLRDRFYLFRQRIRRGIFSS